MVLGIDNVLDKVVVIMCKDLLDDIPAGDPRWNKDASVGIGSSYSMQILHQLEDKQKALSLYLKFLKDSGLWNRLAAYTIRDTPTATVQVLGKYWVNLKLLCCYTTLLVLNGVFLTFPKLNINFMHGIFKYIINF